MDSDPLFETIIECDQGITESDDDSEKENEDNRNIATKSKAKKEQFEKIEVFLKQYNEETIGKEKFNALWSDVITEVNAIGPPVFTAKKWKSKYSQHKYNMKRKRMRNIQEGKSFSQAEVVEDITLVSYETVPVITHPEIVDKLDLIIKKQDAMLEKMDVTNKLLDVIARKA